MNTSLEFDESIYKTVAFNIKKYMEEKNISLKELAKLAEIKENFLKDFINISDNLTISIYDLYKISIILDVSINKFFIK